MEIGIIGAGAFAQAFAKRALKAGHKVKLSNSRGPTVSEKLSNNLVLEQWRPPRKRQQLAKWCFLLCPGTTCPRHLQVFPRFHTGRCWKLIY